MKLPRDFSGERIAVALCREWGYHRIHQSGSHIILDTDEPTHQRVAVPNHHAIRIGTLNSILRAVATHKGVTREDLIRTI